MYVYIDIKCTQIRTKESRQDLCLLQLDTECFIGGLSENAVAFAVNGMIKRLLYRDDSNATTTTTIDSKTVKNGPYCYWKAVASAGYTRW
jgi:hypothetical protein